MRPVRRERRRKAGVEIRAPSLRQKLVQRGRGLRVAARQLRIGGGSLEVLRAVREEAGGRDAAIAPVLLRKQAEGGSHQPVVRAQEQAVQPAAPEQAGRRDGDDAVLVRPLPGDRLNGRDDDTRLARLALVVDLQERLRHGPILGGKLRAVVLRQVGRGERLLRLRAQKEFLHPLAQLRDIVERQLSALGVVAGFHAHRVVRQGDAVKPVRQAGSERFLVGQLGQGGIEGRREQLRELGGRLRRVRLRPDGFREGDPPAAAARQLVFAVRGESEEPDSLLPAEAAGARGERLRRLSHRLAPLAEEGRLLVEQEDGRPVLGVDERGERVIGEDDGPVDGNVEQLLDSRLKERRAAQPVELADRDGAPVLESDGARTADKQAARPTAERIGGRHRDGVQISALVHHADEDGGGGLFGAVLALVPLDAEGRGAGEGGVRIFLRLHRQIQEVREQDGGGDHHQAHGPGEREAPHGRAAGLPAPGAREHLLPQRALRPQLSHGSPKQFLSRLHA